MHAHEQTCEQWTDLASRAFALGYQDGLRLSTPKTSRMIVTLLMAHMERRVVDRRKIRQVYGAGFDLGKMAPYVATSGKWSAP